MEQGTRLELEVDERLEVGGDELVEHEDGGHDDNAHKPNRHQGEIDAVPALEMFRQPVDDHAHHEEGEHRPVVAQDFWNGGGVPVPADTVDHGLGRVPGRLVGNGRV